MKTIISKRLLTSAICLMVCVTAFAQAQIDSSDRGYNLPCSSVWTNYSNPTETYSIVRSNVTNHVVYIREKENAYGDIRHIFIIKKGINSPATAFSTSFGMLKNSSVVISDMRLYGDTCYFCGRVGWAPTGSGSATRGFVGRFVTNEIVGDSGSVKYYIVDTTAQLTRLAISILSGYPLLISAIGEEYYSGKACIVELANLGTLGWEKRYGDIYSADNIVFSDIMTMRDSLTLLAQYACVNDNPPFSNDYDYSHQIFLLDRFSLRGCYATHAAGYCNMALYCMPIFADYYFHHDRTPMRLFHINDKAHIEDKPHDFGVAFGVMEEDGFHGGIRLFKFHHAWEYYNSLYYRAGAGSEIKEIGNQYKSDTLYVLSTSSSSPNGLIALPSMGIGPNPVTILSHYAYTLNSLTQKFTGNHIDISGHDGSFDFHLFDQYIYHTSTPTCFPSDTRQYEPLPIGRADTQYMNWKFSGVKLFVWKLATIEKIQLSSDVICEQCK